jgi:hypothetical protein
MSAKKTNLDVTLLNYESGHVYEGDGKAEPKKEDLVEKEKQVKTEEVVESEEEKK